jgi:glycosyltransferase involved in cell wall biosynthesis
VTVVIATYGRPDALTCAIESIRRQTFGDWTVLVVGDCCERSATVMRQLSDDRIRFVNTPARFGEQSGPNSVGMALAETPLLAFLNHDDLWLPDHLERGVAQLEATSAEIWIGSAATLVRGSGPRPTCIRRSPERRTLADAFAGALFLFEPASAWVLTADLARRVGPWRPRRVLYRSSLVDWLLRAWREGAVGACDETVTTLKLNTHHPGGRHGGEYDSDAADQRVMLELIDSHGADGIRQLVDADLDVRARTTGNGRDPFRAYGRGWRSRWRQLRLDRGAARRRYLATGDDLYERIEAARGRERGQRLGMPRRHHVEVDLETAIEDCRRQLAGDSR